MSFKKFPKSIPCHGSTPHTHYSHHFFWCYSKILVPTLLNAIHHYLCTMVLTTAPINIILFTFDPASFPPTRLLHYHDPHINQHLQSKRLHLYCETMLDDGRNKYLHMEDGPIYKWWTDLNFTENGRTEKLQRRTRTCFQKDVRWHGTDGHTSALEA